MSLLPTVQLIGAQKAGTSAISEWLFEGGFRPSRVFDGEPYYYRKEAHFFDIDWNFHRGMEYYASRYEGTCGAPALDATPDTLAFAQRVHDIYLSAGCATTVKIIVVLRDPIARELSLYNHLVYDCQRLDPSQLSDWHKQVTKTDNSIMSFDEFVRDVSLPALATDEAQDYGLGRSSRHGLYANHLQDWFRLFDRNQILVLSYDELCNNPKKLQQRVQGFIGRIVPGDLCHKNSSNSPIKVQMPSCEARQCLQSFMKPHNERLYQLLEAHIGPPMEQRPFPRFSNEESVGSIIS
ncbi:hypothetical protein ACHAXA_006709 [Cyclostephanos tholiformis]|uniref:Sulfotransferase domain-containing protein n=1 Tax=Cyclostephanos tholiformis TaxID=382380 RepID=A0ABD3SRB2_9STRA